MLSEEQIQDALRASRVIPLGVTNPHGPFGLEQLAEAIARLTASGVSHPAQELVERPLALPRSTWDKLDQLARETTQATSHQTTASRVAALLLEQCVNDAEYAA